MVRCRLGRVLVAVTVLALVMQTRAGFAQSFATPGADGHWVGTVDVGGRNLHFECMGSGSPTVILEAGFRTRADVWTDDLVQPDNPRIMVLPGIAEFTRVCAYDRPGTATVTDGGLQPSRSDPTPMPRTARDAVADLRALLEDGGIPGPGPYVLVGHSYGGMLVRLYAATYPDEVAGMVLVDAFSETLEDEMSVEQWAAYEEIFQPVPPELANYRDLDFTELDTSTTQVRDAVAAVPLRPIPLVVLSRGQAMAMPADLPGGLTGEGLEEAWQNVQDGLAALLPDARHVIATKSEHYIQLQQPELVSEAVREVVDAVRDPASWAEGTPGPASPVATAG